MNTSLKKLISVVALVALAPLALAADLTEGEVRKIDKDAKKITLKHAEIKSLDMPAMTMVFQVKDPALLDAVKPGDKVKFVVEMVGTAMVITEISAVK
jgi:Cu/Ag efflux protein CusF